MQVVNGLNAGDRGCHSDMNNTFEKCDEPNADGWYRWRCTRPWCDIKTTWVNPKKENIRCSCSAPPMLGDWLVRAASWFGVKQNGCGGCSRRQEVLNHWSWHVVRFGRLAVGVPHDLLAKSLLRIAALLKRTKS
ncbi:hypothetical protein [uncultured Mediterranean phage uvDeep-CGR2-KM19-C37]|nr:hypothetical protein [uncultured Mediterranean phage uvDeep-CGR2-KM19-C37]